MNAYQAQRVRFGILAARHMLERDRLTADQVDDLEGFVLAGWKYRDAAKAFDAEFATGSERILGLRSRASLRALDRKAGKRGWLNA